MDNKVTFLYSFAVIFVILSTIQKVGGHLLERSVHYKQYCKYCKKVACIVNQLMISCSLQNLANPFKTNVSPVEDYHRSSTGGV